LSKAPTDQKDKNKSNGDTNNSKIYIGRFVLQQFSNDLQTSRRYLMIASCATNISTWKGL